MEALIGNVLRNRRYEIAGGEDLKVAVNLGVHAGAVDDGAVPVHRIGRFELHFLEGEWIPNDIASNALQVFAFVGLDTSAAVYVEAGMLPALEHPGTLGREKALLAQKGDELGPEEFFDRIHAVLRQDQEAFVAQEKAVCHEQV